MAQALVGDRGSVTIEAALALASLVIVAAAIIAGVSTMAAYLSAIDIAGAAARSHAIGVDYNPPRGAVVITQSDGMVTATARVPSPLRTMSAHASYPVEFE
ncbi:hypothetical protein CAQUA_00970 [Corynebacterium aquatimens]|nr:hypothetical protein CAQUA_00970 [Corynebacterium aquatimens]